MDKAADMNAEVRAAYEKYFFTPCKNGDVVTISKLTVREGRLTVSDAMYFDMSKTPYTQAVPVGEYEVKACILRTELDTRIMAVAVPLSDKLPVSFVLAADGTEDPAKLADDEFIGFSVDAGLAVIADTAAQKAYCEFKKDWCAKHKKKWYSKHSGGNFYVDYLLDIFKKSPEADPVHQRAGGDFIDLTIPGTDMHIPMFSTGWGDGYYPVYWGYSEDGQLASLVITFIDPSELDEEL